MFEIEASDIQLFILIPMLIDHDYYRVLDPDELIDQQYLIAIQKRDQCIHSRTIPELYQPLFITNDYRAVFRPAALDLVHISPEQSVQAIVPSLNIVVQFKWNFELMCNLALLTLEIQMPPFTSLAHLNDLLYIAQSDTFSWALGDGWLVPHHSITKMLDVPSEEPLGLVHIIHAFEKLLNTHAFIQSQNPFVTYLLQMNTKGGHEFRKSASDLGEDLLAKRYHHLSTLLGYHEDQKAFLGPNWRCAQTFVSCGWYEWQPPQHRSPQLTQHRYTSSTMFTTSMQRRRAARRVFKIATMDYVAARLMDYLLASQGEANRLRAAIHDLWRSKAKSSALYYDVLFKLSHLESRYMLLNTNVVNPDWVLDNPLGEGNSFIKLMGYIQQEYGIINHLQALRELLNLFNRMLDRCQ